MDYETIVAKAKEYALQDPSSGPWAAIKLAAAEAIIDDVTISTEEMYKRVGLIRDAKTWQTYHVLRILVGDLPLLQKEHIRGYHRTRSRS